MCLSLSCELTLGLFATHSTVDFQNQCQDYGFVFLLTNNLISVKVMLFCICTASNEYLYFLFTHLAATLTKFTMSAICFLGSCF